MGGLSDWKKQLAAEVPAQAGRETDKAVKKQLALAAGTERFENRDPIYHITESFRQTFDLMGQQRAQGVKPETGQILQSYMNERVPGLDWKDGEGAQSVGPASGNRLSEKFLHETSMDEYYKTRPQPPGQRLLNRFSEISFNRGIMASAILQGQGRMMLFSCLKRTLCQNQPSNIRERMLFQSNSKHKQVPANHEDLEIFNRGFADSALALVVDVTKDAGEIVDSLVDMAEGRGGMGGSGEGTLHKMYPFLTDLRERELLSQYREKLQTLGDEPETKEQRNVLQHAVNQTEALITKKAQMKRDFTQKLRSISYSARTASAVFSQDEFRQELYKRLAEEEPDALPPPDDDGDGKGRNGKPDAPPDENPTARTEKPEAPDGGAASADSAQARSDTESGKNRPRGPETEGGGKNSDS